jgi:hypothetical protein
MGVWTVGHLDWQCNGKSSSAFRRKDVGTISIHLYLMDRRSPRGSTEAFRRPQRVHKILRMQTRLARMGIASGHDLCVPRSQTGRNFRNLSGKNFRNRQLPVSVHSRGFVRNGAGPVQPVRRLRRSAMPSLVLNAMVVRQSMDVMRCFKRWQALRVRPSLHHRRPKWCT